MKESLFIFLMLLITAGSTFCQGNKEDHNNRTNKSIDDIIEYSDRTIIAFGSCSRQYISNQRWLDILNSDPDIWIWLGDNIYGDTHDMDLMAEKYAYQKADSGYQLLLKSGVQIIGTWDDHDYGVNDGGKNALLYEYKPQLYGP